MSEQQQKRTHYKPTPQLTQFIDSVLERRGWVAAGSTAATLAVIEHTGQQHLLIDANGKEYNDQSLYELVRRRVVAHAESDAVKSALAAGERAHADFKYGQVKLVPAPNIGAHAAMLFALGRSVTEHVWALIEKGDADTLRAVYDLLREGR